MERRKEPNQPKTLFINLKSPLKELRETHRWIQLVKRVPLVKNPDLLEDLLNETDQLIRIFVASIHTAQLKKTKNNP